MNATWVKLLIPIGIGAVAAGLHFKAIADPMPTEKFTRVNMTVPAGATITEASLEEVIVSGPQEVIEALRLTALPYKERKLIEGRPAPRELRKNDMLFIRDTWAFGSGLTEPWAPIAIDKVDVQTATIQVGCEITFKVPKSAAGGGAIEFDQLGPFRVLAVGTRISQLTGGSKDETSDKDKIIAIPVKYNPKGELDDENFNKLLAALASAQSAGNGKIAIAVNPTPPPRKPAPN